jgi:hypothetical protein
MEQQWARLNGGDRRAVAAATHLAWGAARRRTGSAGARSGGSPLGVGRDTAAAGGSRAARGGQGRGETAQRLPKSMGSGGQ